MLRGIGLQIAPLLKTGGTSVADRANLYSIQGGNRSANFGFNVSVICPKEAGKNCTAEASVVDGKIGPVTVSIKPAGFIQNHRLATN